MKTPPLTFEPFARLPKELRLRVWSLSFPDSRIIDLRIVDGEDNKISHNRQPGSGHWHWASAPNSTPLPQLLVNHEARNVVLKSYQKTEIREHEGRLWKPAFIDFTRDVLALNWYRCEPIRQLSMGTDFTEHIVSPWMSQTRNLAVRVSTILNNGWNLYHADIAQWTTKCNTPAGRKDGVRGVLTIIEHFPMLKQLKLICMDAREKKFPGPDQIIEPPEAYTNHCEPHERMHTIVAVEFVLNDVRAQHPDLKLPDVKLAALINGGYDEELKRRWGFDYAKSSFVDPIKKAECHLQPQSEDYERFGFRPCWCSNERVRRNFEVRRLINRDHTQSNRISNCAQAPAPMVGGRYFRGVSGSLSKPSD